ncbi:MAG: UvrD-helicase domain-containing protein, partial [Alphaproteobacteria bacterium]
MSLISNLSEIQNQASNPNFCVWVSASAGSGKTSLLKNRYLRLILSGVPIEKILCITYTNAGTNEMKERILADIKKWQNLSDEELKENLNSLLFKRPTATEINNARKAFDTIINNKDVFNIRTIHSFCQTILKKFPFEAGVSVNFTA